MHVSALEDMSQLDIWPCCGAYNLSSDHEVSGSLNEVLKIVNDIYMIS